MRWDRFDITEAFWVYAKDWHDGQFSRVYAIFGSLDRMHFKPGLTLRHQGIHGLTDNGREILRALVSGALHVRDRR